MFLPREMLKRSLTHERKQVAHFLKFLAWVVFIKAAKSFQKLPRLRNSPKLIIAPRWECVQGVASLDRLPKDINNNMTEHKAGTCKNNLPGMRHRNDYVSYRSVS